MTEMFVFDPRATGLVVILAPYALASRKACVTAGKGELGILFANVADLRIFQERINASIEEAISEAKGFAI